VAGGPGAFAVDEDPDTVTLTPHIDLSMSASVAMLQQLPWGQRTEWRFFRRHLSEFPLTSGNE
jgi:hypothetical protein